MAQQGKFKRSLNLLDLTFLGLGSIVGSGWLFASQKVARLAGAEAWMAWVFGAIAVLLIGLVYSELGSAIPRAGGFVRYPDYTHGSLTGFLAGFSSMLAYSSVAGIEVEAVRGYAQYWWPGLGTPKGDPTALGIFIELLLLVVFFLINYWSVNVFGKTNTVVTTIKFVVPALTIIVLLTQMHGGNFSIGGASPGGLHGVLQAVSGGGIVFAFLGFRQAVDYGAEAKNPQRDIPRAIVSGVLLAMVIYLFLQVSFLGAVPADKLTGGWGGVNFDSPFAGLAAVLGLGWLANVLLIDAVISPAGTGNIYLSGTCRVLFAWAKNGYFYTIFSKVDPRTGVPRGALWLSLLLSMVWILPFKFQVWDGLVNAVTSATVMTYMIGPISAASLRRSSPDLARPFRLKPLGLWAPLAFIAATWIIYWSGWSTDSLLIGLTLSSLILYFSFMDKDQSTRDRVKTEWKSGAWLIVYYIFIFIMSRIGSFGPENSTPVIPQPWDSIIVAIGGLIIYYWGVNSALAKPRIAADETLVETTSAQMHA